MGMTTCVWFQGDAGGPLMCKSGNSWTQVAGLPNVMGNSSMVRSERAADQSTFTSTARFSSFLKETLGVCRPPPTSPQPPPPRPPPPPPVTRQTHASPCPTSSSSPPSTSSLRWSRGSVAWKGLTPVNFSVVLYLMEGSM